ncbi:MAG: response regulator transcription factor [Endomicrobiales bacterium]
MEKKKILIVEDDIDTVEAMRLMLEAKGYGIIAAFDYEDGLSKVRSEKPDLVILDVMLMLHDKTGFDLAVEIRRDPSTAAIPVLMITSINSIAASFRFSPATDDEYLPVDEFIDKPAQPDELYAKVDRLLKMKTSGWVNWPDKPKA